MGKGTWVRCPECGDKYLKASTGRGRPPVTCADPRCAESYAIRKQNEYRDHKRAIVNYFLRKGCFFAYLSTCKTEGNQGLCLARKDGTTLYNHYGALGAMDLKKVDLASLVEHPSEVTCLCVHHFMMYVQFKQHHPADEYPWENSMLHVIDAETPKASDEKEMK